MSRIELTQVIYESNQGIAKITLNRPQKLNSFTAQMHAEIRSALDLVDQDPSIRVVLITGAGKGFCAGQDLSDPQLALDNLAQTLEKNYNPLIARLTSMPQVVIASVHGVAAGAGCNLALAADLTIASKSAAFIQAFINIGLMPDAGGTWFLPKRVGLQKAMGLALTGEKITGEQADQMGLIWKSFSDETLISETEQLANHLASLPGLALTEIKKAMYSSMHRTLAEQLEVECQAQDQLGRTQDFHEGVSAFLEKRPAKFKSI
jgi:2-(1,2-epoxy-1,2-dihydrophenyl)acetyl-CoA isomerase